MYERLKDNAKVCTLADDVASNSTQFLSEPDNNRSNYRIYSLYSSADQRLFQLA